MSSSFIRDVFRSLFGLSLTIAYIIRPSLAEELLADKQLLKPGGGLFDPANLDLLYYCNAALKANFVLQKDIDYIVKDGQIVIIDSNTGRAMSGRRWSDGFHQAVEAKERVDIQKENQTMASITLQNYFLQYQKVTNYWLSL